MSGRALQADVCVVGGGPAGAATAWELACRGANVTLLDRSRFPRDKPCAEYLSPEASRVLARMGALEDLERGDGARLTGMRVHAPDGSFFHGEFAASHGFHGFRDEGLAIRRTVLDASLLDTARKAGVHVIESAAVTDLERDTRGRISGVRARAGGAGELTVHARMVIGADGLRSIVSRRMGVARRARWPARLALVTHYRGVAGTTSCGEMHVSHDGYLGIAPVGELANVALVVPLRSAAGIAGAPDRFLDDWIHRRPLLADRFARAARATPIRATGPFASRVTRAWIPGAAVVGDAADFFDPFTGEGIYAALHGAEMLAPLVLDVVCGARREPDAIRTYETLRRREFGAKRRLEWLVAAAVANPAIMNRVAAVFSRRKDLADLLVGVCGDFVPPRELLRPRFLLPMVAGAIAEAIA